MRWLIAIGLLWLPAAEAAELLDLRVWAGPETTRVVFDLDEVPEYRIFSLESPDRVVVDFQNSAIAGALDKSGGLLSGVRTGARADGAVRVVLDLASAAESNSFVLPPTGDYGYRLVVDLSSSEPAGPVRTLRDIAPEDRDIVVAIDAGHGGEDPGAIGPGGTREKDVTLKIARMVAESLNELPGFRGHLIRDGDYYIPIGEQPNRAREAYADLFISIHADAFYDRRVKGAGVFVLAPRRATSEAARWLADRANRSDLVGGVQLVDKDDTVAAVLLDLSQSASMDASRKAAEAVFGALRDAVPTHKKHVDKASLVVLTAPDIPSMLVETGFISNPQEEKRLRSSAGQRKVADAIVRGVLDYFSTEAPPGTLVARVGVSQHVVKRGDTLSEIASRHGVTVAKLRAVNELRGDRLLIGDVLTIPRG